MLILIIKYISILIIKYTLISIIKNKSIFPNESGSEENRSGWDIPKLQNLKYKNFLSRTNYQNKCILIQRYLQAPNSNYFIKDTENQLNIISFKIGNPPPPYIRLSFLFPFPSKKNVDAAPNVLLDV